MPSFNIPLQNQDLGENHSDHHCSPFPGGQSHKMTSFSLSQTLLLVLSAVGSVSAGVDNWLSPQYKWTYQFPLPIPPVKAPSKYVFPSLEGLNIN